jgi:ribosome modulation factor
MMLTVAMSNIHIVGTPVLLAKENNGQASYNRGYQLGRKDARSNPNGVNRRHRDEASQWDSDFRRGYEDGYAGRSKNNSAYGRSRNDGIYDDETYDRSRNDGIYDRPRNDDVYGRSGDQSYRDPGTMAWRGRVDDYVELNIQGNRVRSREREGSQTLNEQVSFSNPLPRADVAATI